ncbi:HpcH/HpaI aldolase/citrate lyase family protein [Gordonia hydrophobica]|uniref:HpcH/HpaI aldolase/citrate lyase family protein n=1 Tax=Gordonia hydrophobica TaxID=40516 RepID=A0ABZ2U5E7_9ACTN|nr:HpcH/HpaI aldolase/citrate lyase family protein [Gordonia hydrophobica]MBM7368788.1 citrate lyase beta subunit [Gordonia hydrophobica]
MSGVSHFRHLPDDVLDDLFLRRPQTLTVDSSPRRIAFALGATLYVPATRSDLTSVIRRRADSGVTSMVIDLEDAVDDDHQHAALESAITAVNELAEQRWSALLLFIRIRTPDQIATIVERLAPGHALAGFVLPKFEAATGEVALAAVAQAARQTGHRLYAMPVLETAAVVHRETRDDELVRVREILNRYRDLVLAVRIGATDICGLFGIRRDRDVTIYDVRVAADVIASIVNMLGRSDRTGFVITGPVWEYFANHERMFAPTLRHTPFRNNDAVVFRKQLVNRDLDGLLREIALDHANGISGKTVIHPAHVGIVHALSCVTEEEYRDALDIADHEGGGAQPSAFRNKMNELKPHRNWALDVLDRAAVFGVTRHDVNFVDLLTAWSGE